ncbi:MAG TPA: FecR domain-containing protein [Bauldia sp.]|nr:FecR domain-containing protein [Bauldia sp.]
MRTIPALIFSATLVAASLAGGALVAQPSGVVLAVVQQSEADGQTGKRVLLVEAPVYSGDHIVTGPTGQAQVKFRDDTKLVVGPNSTMIIDAFVFSDQDSARQISINAVKGAFRFITGKSPKDAYSITTPTATIGVRG